MHPRATVDRALHLSSQGLIDREVAQITGVRSVRFRNGGRAFVALRQKEQRHANCPRCDGVPLNEPAYAYLLGLYLGDGHMTRQREEVYSPVHRMRRRVAGPIEAAKQAMETWLPTSGVFGVQAMG